MGYIYLRNVNELQFVGAGMLSVPFEKSKRKSQSWLFRLWSFEFDICLEFIFWNL